MGAIISDLKVDMFTLPMTDRQTEVHKYVCYTEAQTPTIRKTMKTINMHARCISITALISSGALSLNKKKKST